MLSEAFAQSLHWFYRPKQLDLLLPRVTRVKTPLLTVGTFHLLVDSSGQVAACGGWTKEAPSTGEIIDGLAHIRHFATSPDYAGMGMGRRIFETCLSEAAAAGIKIFTCEAALGSEGFYAALGFAVVDQRTAEMGGGMRLPLKIMTRRI